MPKPFPFPLTVGTDICHAKRICDILTTGILVENRSTFPSIIKRIYKIVTTGTTNTVFTKKNGSASVYGEAKFRRGVRLEDRGERFIHKVLTPEEVADSLKMGRLDYSFLREDGPQHEHYSQYISKMARFLAGRWAAKEAVMKAFPSLQLNFHDITIQTPQKELDKRTQPPFAVIKKSADGFDFQDGQEVPISISHDGEYATAVAFGFNRSIKSEHVSEADDSNNVKTSSPTKNSIPAELDVEIKSTPSNNISTKIDAKVKRPSPQYQISKPDAGAFTIRVSNINPVLTSSFILTLFKQRYPSLRWITMDIYQHIRGSTSYKVGTVTFGSEEDAWHALENMDGYELVGKKLEVTTITTTPTDEGDRIYNLDYDPDCRNNFKKVEYPEKRTTKIDIKHLETVQNVFQDDPLIISESQNQYKFGGSWWNTDEIIRTATWDAILGEHIDPLELEESRLFDQQKRKMKRIMGQQRPKNTRELFKDASRLRNKGDWKKLVPLAEDLKNNRGVRKRRGLSIHP